jgi:hypothetical protein
MQRSLLIKPVVLVLLQGGNMQPASSAATDAADAEPSTTSHEEPADQGSQGAELAQPLAADECPPEPVLEASTPKQVRC